MRQLFLSISLIFLFAITGNSQAIVKGSGILYTNGAPTDTINVNYHSELAIDTTTGFWYEFQRDSGIWVKAGYRVYHWDNEGVPTYTPTDKQSHILINNGDSLFHYRSGTWNLISGGSGLVSNEISLSGNIITSDINGVYIDTTIIIGNNQLTFSSDSIKSSINGINSNAIYLGSYLDNTDDQKIDTFEIVSNQLRISNENDGENYKSVDLSGYIDNTDDQALTITGTKGTIRLEDGGSVILADSLTNNEGLLSVSESGGVGQILSNTLGSNTIWMKGQGITSISESGDTLYFTSTEIDGDSLNEIQVIDTFLISNDTIFLSLDRDLENAKYVVLPAGVVDTDNQVIDTFSIVSNILRLSIEDDGEAFKSVDLSGYMDNTDSQTLSYNPATDEITISGGNTIDISEVDTDTDNQQIDTLDINNNFLRISLQGDGKILDSVSLAPYLDNTDSQNLSWDNGSNTMNISGGAGAVITGFLESEVDGSTTNEIQEIDSLFIDANYLKISLSNDGLIYDSVSLASYLDNTDSQTLSYDAGTDQITISGGNTIDITEVNTDNQAVDTFKIESNYLKLSISGDNKILDSVDLSSYMDDTDTQDLTITGGGGTIRLVDGGSVVLNDSSATNEIQQIDTLDINNNYLRISLLNDAKIRDSVSLSPYLDNTDSQGFSGSDDGTTFTLDLSGTASDISFKEGSGVTITRSGTELTFAASGGSGITSLNSQTGSTQTFATGTSGTDFNISSGSDIHTFNIPDASASARGLITTGDQTIAGEKTINDTLKLFGSYKIFKQSASSTLPGFKLLSLDNELLANLGGNTSSGQSAIQLYQNKNVAHYGYLLLNNSDTSMTLATSSPTTIFNGSKFRFVQTATERLAISTGGNIAVTGNGSTVTNPTAKLHIAAQSTSANTAPIKLTSGSLMTAAEAGAIEFNSDRLYFTKTTGPTRETIAYLSDVSGISDGDKGDITVSSSGTVWTIDNDIVTFAKMQNVSANSVLANNTGSSGDVAEVALAASELLGRGSTGNVAAITLGAGLSMSGTTLNVSGGSGITSLNGLTGATQTMVTATGGTDFNISSSGTTHTFNLPDHGSGVRGVINTGSQSIYGAKTFTSTATFAPGSGSSIVINSGGSIHGFTNGNLTGVILQNTAGVDAIHALANSTSDYSLYTIIEPGGTVGTDGMEIYHLGGSYSSSQLFSNQSVIFRGNATVTNGMRYILDASAPILFANGGYNTTNERMRIDSDGNIAISGGGTVITDATARLHISAGGTGIAPLKFNSGSLLSTPEVGAFEFNSDRIYFTKTTGATRETIAYLSDVSGISDGDKGDITVSGSGTVWNIDAGVVGTTELDNGGVATIDIADDAVTYDKIQNVSANSVLANNTGSSGSVAEVSLSASQLLGRGSTGNVAAITLGTNLSLSGTTLNASGGGGGAEIYNYDGTILDNRYAKVGSSTDASTDFALGYYPSNPTLNFDARERGVFMDNAGYTYIMGADSTDGVQSYMRLKGSVYMPVSNVAGTVYSYIDMWNDYIELKTNNSTSSSFRMDEDSIRTTSSFLRVKNAAGTDGEIRLGLSNPLIINTAGIYSEQTLDLQSSGIVNIDGTGSSGVYLTGSDDNGTVYVDGFTNYSSTSTTKEGLSFYATYQPTSGSFAYIPIRIVNTYDLGGTASGTQIGIQINPFLTGLASGSYRAIDIPFTNSAGWGIYQSGALTKNLFSGETQFDKQLKVAEISAPATPASGFGYTYAKTDGKIYFKNDGGTEYDLTATGAASPSIISPSSISSNQDDYNPTGFGDANFIRITSSDFYGIRSIAAQSDGEEKTFINISSYPFYFPAEHPDGTAANRISYSEDLILMPGGSLKLMYDGTSSRWRPINYQPASNSAAKVIESCDFGGGSVTAGNLPTIGVSGNISSQGPSIAIPLNLSSKALHTSSSTTGGGAIYFNKTSYEVFLGYTAHASINALVSLRDLSDGTNTYTAYMDALASPNSTTETPNNSFGIRYSHGTNSGKWEGYSVNTSGTTSTVDLGVTVAEDTEYELRIEIDRFNMELRFYVNGTFAGRITSNLPATYSRFSPRLFIKKSAGTTARYFDTYKFCYKVIRT